MKLINNIIYSLFLFFATCTSLYGQENCNLYFDNLKPGDTLKISITIHINRGKEFEQVLIYKNENEKIFAILNYGENKKNHFELTNSKINTIKEFENAVRNQKLTSDRIYIHSLAEYKIFFKQGVISYSTREDFYSLSEELLK